MKKILISLSIIAAVAAVVVYGTTAFFSDTETAIGNTFSAGTIDKAIGISKIADEKSLREALEQYKESHKLIELENALDRLYFEHAIRGAESLPEHGKEFKEFLLHGARYVFPAVRGGMVGGVPTASAAAPAPGS